MDDVAITEAEFEIAGVSEKTELGKHVIGLIRGCVKDNVEKLTLDVDDVIVEGRSVGSWTLLLQKDTQPKTEPEA